MNKEEKDRILKCVLEQIKQERISARKRCAKRTAAVILAATTVFSCGAFTVKVLDLDSRLAQQLGGTSSQLTSAVTNLAAAVEKDGLRIEAKQAVGDGHRVFVLVQVTSMTELRFDRTCSFEFYELKMSQSENFAAGLNPMEDAVSEDGKSMSMLLEIASEEPVNRQEVMLEMKNFGKMMHIKEKEQKVLRKGDWKLSFTLQYKNVSTEYKPGTLLPVGKGKVRVDSVELSPISCFIRISTAEYSADMAAELENLPLDAKICMKEGTEIPVRVDGSSWISDGKNSSGTWEGVMGSLIDMDRVESISLCGRTIPLE